MRIHKIALLVAASVLTSCRKDYSETSNSTVLETLAVPTELHVARMNEQGWTLEETREDDWANFLMGDLFGEMKELQSKLNSRLMAENMNNG